MSVVMPFTIRYGETDMMGVVYHANYLLYFEDAREHFLDTLGYSYAKLEEMGYASPVLSVNAKYLKSLRYGHRPVVRTRVSALKPMRVTFSYEIFESREAMEAGERPNCIGSTEHCLVDASSFKSVSMKKAAPHLYELYASVLEEDA